MRAPKQIILTASLGIAAATVWFDKTFALFLQPQQTDYCRMSSYWIANNKLGAVRPTADGNIAGGDVTPNGIKVYLNADEQDSADSIAYWRDDGTWARPGSYTEALVVTVNQSPACPGHDNVKYRGDTDNGIDYVVDDLVDNGTVIVVEAKQMTESLGMRLGSTSVGLQLSRSWINRAADDTQKEDLANEGAALVKKALATRGMLVPVGAGVYPRDWGWGFWGKGYLKGGFAYFQVDADNPR
jgi:hypothetical protein